MAFTLKSFIHWNVEDLRSQKHRFLYITKYGIFLTNKNGLVKVNRPPFLYEKIRDKETMHKRTLQDLHLWFTGQLSSVHEFTFPSLMEIYVNSWMAGNFSLTVLYLLRIDFQVLGTFL